MVTLGVNAVVTDEAGRVLLALRDRPPIWNLPGGSVEPGETPWDAAVREVAEEVGLVVRVDRLSGVYDRNPDGDPVLVFTATVLAGEIRASAEAVLVRWFDPAALPEPINPYQPQRIADAVTVAAGPPALRHQAGPSVRALFPDSPDKLPDVDREQDT